MTVREEKAALRREAARRVAALPDGYLTAAGRAMAAHVTALLEYRRAGTVFAFVSTSREPDTRPLLERILRDGKRLALPACTGPGMMACRLVTDLGALRPGTYGIMEPPERCPVISPEQIGLVIAPCAACDSRGSRLGRGGGYYDRFFAAYTGPALALCPAALLAEDIPMGPWDRPVPLVVTEDGALRVRLV